VLSNNGGDALWALMALVRWRRFFDGGFSIAEAGHFASFPMLGWKR
jgi:hypothetical protein